MKNDIYPGQHIVMFYLYAVFLFHQYSPLMVIRIENVNILAMLRVPLFADLFHEPCFVDTSTISSHYNGTDRSKMQFVDLVHQALQTSE